MDQKYHNEVKLAGFVASDVRDATERGGPVEFRLKYRSADDKFDMYDYIVLWNDAATKCKSILEGDFFMMAGQVGRKKFQKDEREWYVDIFTTSDSKYVAFERPKVIKEEEAVFPEFDEDPSPF